MKDYISKLVDRFLNWKLPEDFSPDCGISFKRTHSEFGPFGPQKHEPVGTNLLTADQARAMLEHILPPMPENRYSTEAEGDAYTHGWFDGNEAEPYGQPPAPTGWLIYTHERIDPFYWHGPTFDGDEWNNRPIKRKEPVFARGVGEVGRGND
jgi:hypothetical protein